MVVMSRDAQTATFAILAISHNESSLQGRAGSATGRLHDLIFQCGGSESQGWRGVALSHSERNFAMRGQINVAFYGCHKR